MYESFFEFHARPFPAAPSAAHYFGSESAEHARETISRCIERAEGPTMIIGPAGTGKSTLCQVLASQFRDRFHVAMLASARLCTRRALLQNILFELKLPYRDREEGELRLSLIDYLEPKDDGRQGMLLIIDEAHMLPLRLLEEVRMITNLVRDGQPRVRLVMAASPILDERFASPRLESFNQRIAARCYLQSMNCRETAEYIRAQVTAAAGNVADVFSEEALTGVYRATDGIPRLVNQVCDHALMLASIGRKASISGQGIEEAWADLQQLPTPWTETESSGPVEQSDILEFGALDDDSCGELDGVNADLLADSDEPTLETSRPMATLASIESTLTTLEEDYQLAAEEEQFRPRVENNGPEIELVFHQAHDPFTERFEEEEVIVDPFASIGALSGKNESRESEHAEATQTIPINQDAAEDVGETTPQPTAGPAVDPVMPDYADEPINVQRPVAASDGEDVPGDDRDLLEIFEDGAAGPNTAVAEPKARRREYRQLFASLRRR
jgi:type II secretory pathway predicted ATPase ExeA